MGERGVMTIMTQNAYDRHSDQAETGRQEERERQNDREIDE